MLLITNRRQGSRAVYGKIRVLGSAGSKLVSLGVGQDSPKHLPPAFSATDTRPKGADCWPDITIGR